MICHNFCVVLFLVRYSIGHFTWPPSCLTSFISLANWTGSGLYPLLAPSLNFLSRNSLLPVLLFISINSELLRPSPVV